MSVAEQVFHGFYTNDLNSFGILPFFAAGLSDSINPCALTTTIIFINLLLYCHHHQNKIFWPGLGFIFSVFITWISLASTLFDRILTNPITSSVIHSVYLILAVAFIILSALSVRDWWILANTKEKIKVVLNSPRWSGLPGGLAGEPITSLKSQRKIHGKKLFILALGGGFIMTFLASAWGPHANVALILYMTGLPGMLPAAILRMILYGVGFVIPLIFVLFTFGYIMSFMKFPEFLNQSITKIKIIWGATLLALGLGLIYSYLGNSF